MTTEIWIENKKLDVSKDISTLLNFAIDDVANFADRSTSWSKTIVLPGTATNNKLFGHIFEIGHANSYDPELPNVEYNFNAAKSADCLIFQDNLQTFKGVLRLLEIISEDGSLEYECQAIGELAGLNVALSSGLLEDLDFSAYDHVYNHTNIVASWDNTPGTGYYYPLIDHGNYSDDKHNWDIKTFRPALYVKEYIDKIFEAAGYRYSSALFDTARFKSLIIPHNQKTLQQLGTVSMTAIRTTDYQVVLSSSNFGFIKFETTSLDGFSQNPDKSIFRSTSPEEVAISINVTISGTCYKAGGSASPVVVTLQKSIFSPTGSEILATHVFQAQPNQNIAWSATFENIETTLSEVDGILIRVEKSAAAGISVRAHTATMTAASTSSVLVPIQVGYTIEVSQQIPKNIRQIDFLMSIVRLNNLYVYEDKFDSRLIHITPFVDFYSGEVVDWTYKLNRKKPVRIRPMSQLNAKVYEFKYKPDNDYYNELYKKRYGQDYGSYIYDSEYEFASAKKSFEVIFSGTPLVGRLNEDKIFSSILKKTDASGSEDQTDSNIRILQSKKVTGVSSWNIQAVKGGATLASTTAYGYAGHLNDPDIPSNDLNFGAPEELFFTLATGDLSVNQFNVYWSPYMAEIADKDSKLLTAHFYLTPKDINEMDFSTYIFVDGNLFRLNAIKDYNMSEPGDCQVELLKVINGSYTSETSLLYVDEDYYEDGYVE